MAIVNSGQLRYAKGFGMADLENAVAAKSSTVYRLGSSSKTITATAVMQLMERGKLDLDSPVQKILRRLSRKTMASYDATLAGALSRRARL